MDIINQYLMNYFRKNRIEGCVEFPESDFRSAPRVKCNDGFSMSVQASRYHYCSPRASDAFPYSSFEIGFPSKRIPIASEYAEEPKRHTKTVFGYVPANIVNKIIAEHGGIKELP